MAWSEVRCPNCNAVNLNVSHRCIRCKTQLDFLPSIGNTAPVGFNWDQIYSQLTCGEGDVLRYSLAVIEKCRFPQLVPILGQLYSGQYPNTKTKIKIDDLHKAIILLALGMINSPDAGKMIADLATANQVDYLLDELIPPAGCYAAAICQSTDTSINFLLDRISVENLIANYFIYEALKTYGNPNTIKNLFDGVLCDVNIPDKSNMPYLGRSSIGIALSAGLYLNGVHQENRLTALTNILMFAPNSSPFLVSLLSADVNRCWALQKRIGAIEAIVQKCGPQCLNAVLPGIRKPVEKFLAACVITRISTQPTPWLQEVVSIIDKPYLTTSVAMRLSAYDTLVRHLVKCPNAQVETYISKGLSNNQPIIRAALATSILIHGLERYFPAVFNLLNDPKKDVRISLVYAITLLQIRNPHLVNPILQTTANTNSDQDVKALAYRILTDEGVASGVRAQM